MLNDAKVWGEDKVSPHVWQIGEPPIVSNSSKKYYAVDITVGCSAALSIPSIGLADSHIRLITGRPDFDGTAGRATYENGDANDHVWVEGVLIGDKIGKSSTDIDISKHGGVASLSGFTFSIINTSKQWEYINEDPVYLTNRSITHYVVINNIFYPLWSGVVGDIDYEDISIKISCSNSFQKIHKPFPTSENTVQTVDGDSVTVQTVIPAVIGDVPNAKLVLKESVLTYIDIGPDTYPKYSGIYTYIRYTNRPQVIQLITWENYFADGGLVGKYFVFTAGGGNIQKGRVYKILTNLDSFRRPIKCKGDDVLDPVYYYNVWVTSLTLSESVCDTADLDANFLTKYHMCYDPAGLAASWTVIQNMWVAQVFDLDTKYKISNNGIESVVTDESGYPVINLFDEQQKININVTSMFNELDIADGEIQLNVNNLNNIDTAEYSRYIKPDITSVTSQLIDDSGNVIFTSSIPVTGMIYNLTDKNRTTGMTASHQAESYWTLTPMLIKIDVNDELKTAAKDGKLKLLFDISTNANTDYRYNVSVAIYGFDKFSIKTFYGKRFGLNTFELQNLRIGYADGGNPDITTVYMVPNDFYPSGGYDGGVASNATYGYEKQSGGTYEHIYLNDGANLDDELCSLIASGTVSELWVNITYGRIDSSSDINNLTIGEIVFQQAVSSPIKSDNLTMGVSGEKYLTHETNNLYRALQHILIDYDGISAANIDFGNVETTRWDWHVGRQLTEQKPSFDYVKELCEQSFIGYWQSREGVLKFSNFLYNLSVSGVHDKGAVVRGSIKSIKKTSIMDLYTEFSVKYGYDPNLDKYTKEFFIVKTDQPSFPASSNDTWKTYAGGFLDAEYPTAKILWELCHAAYLITLTTRRFKIECPWFPDLSAFPGKESLTGTGSIAYLFLEYLIRWTAKQKKVCVYDVNINAETVKLEILDYVYFIDDHLTTTEVNGWVTSIVNNPSKSTRTLTIMQNVFVN